MPTCIVSFNGRRLFVRSVRSLSQGEELTLGYVELYASRAERAARLLSSKGFICTCARCRLPADDPLESRLTKGDADVGERALEGWNEGLRLYHEQRLTTSRDVLLALLSGPGAELHPEHAVIVDIHRLLVDVYKGLKDMTGLRRHAQACLRACTAGHLPSNHSLIALYAWHLADASAALIATSKGESESAALRQEAASMYRQAHQAQMNCGNPMSSAPARGVWACKTWCNAVLTLSYGADHPTTRAAAARAAAASRKEH